ncbi:hypothetical protein JOC85_001886 [Bacillus mesophilus]|uniref:Uncharacterized protein n=1 Tax=Bacillus mesophilus TaxID=1808955 RepID=A0A6M0Q4P7_9BACI|nr:hypothetical protein [Bacillus mesophilus]MBM7661114.1 hypothetical protein [Bacillus mesophilus]NEY71356.1 hypothetical protein [Bacillus mesophilus]
MNNTLVTKVKRFIAFLVIASLMAGVSYLIVFKASILPNGYDLVNVQHNTISLQSFNVIGIEKEITIVSFSGKDIWKIDAIKHEVNRHKEFLWLLFFATTVSIFLLVYKIRKGKKVWKAIVDSNLIFAVLLPLFPLINSANRITELLS